MSSTEGAPADELRVVAVIWTYDRFDLARRCLESVLAQSSPPHRVILVDSASPDGTGRRIRSRFPQIDVIELENNAGPGAAIDAAIRSLNGDLPEYFWLVEDDSMPSPECLAMALEAAAEYSHVGLIAPVGCDMRWGQWYQASDLPLAEHRLVDFVVLDGALLSGDAVRQSGTPRTDYFIMMIDIEYPLRLVRAGFEMVQVGLPYEQLRMGAAATNSSWRSYYQTRNHLRMVFDLRSPRLLAGYVLRTMKHLGYAIIHREWDTLALRSRGFVDAVCGRMGRTVEPPTSPLPTRTPTPQDGTSSGS